MKIVKNLQLKIVIFTAVNNGSIMHGRVFVMLVALETDCSVQNRTWYDCKEHICPQSCSQMRGTDLLQHWYIVNAIRKMDLWSGPKL